MERVYCKNPGIQTLIDESMIHICQDEGPSPKQVFLLFCAAALSLWAIWTETFVCAKHSLFLVVIKEKIL